MSGERKKNCASEGCALMQAAGLEVAKPQFLRDKVSYILKELNSINPVMK